MRQGFLALALAFATAAGVSPESAAGAPAQQSIVPDAPAPQQSVPSAPTPQSSSGPQSDSISGLAREAARGKADPDAPATPAPQADAPSANPQANPDGPPQQEAPYIPANAGDAEKFTIRQNVNFVQIPISVLDSHHGEVPGLTFRDFRVYENGQRQHIDFFSVDPAPLSVAFVIDQSLPRDIMGRVNNSLSAVTGAFTPQDEVAVFTYADGVTQQTTFTAATGDRLPAVLARSKRSGEDMGTADNNSGPFSQGPPSTTSPSTPT